MKELPVNALQDFVLQTFHQPEKVNAVFHYLLARDSFAICKKPINPKDFEINEGIMDAKEFLKAVTDRDRFQQSAQKDFDRAVIKMEKVGISKDMVDKLSLNYMVFPDLDQQYEKGAGRA